MDKYRKKNQKILFVMNEMKYKGNKNKDVLYETTLYVKFAIQPLIFYSSTAIVLLTNIVHVKAVDRAMNSNNLHYFDCFCWLLPSTRLTADLILECSGEPMFRPLSHIEWKNHLYFP